MDWLYVLLFVIAVIVGALLATLKYLMESIRNEGAYKQVSILTDHEKQNYRIIKSVTDKLRLTLFVKVRIADLITPVASGKRYQALFNKIRSKHVDFVICDAQLNVVCAIELDDKSHNSKSRRERDEFVNITFKNVGINLVRSTNFNALEFESQLRGLMSSVLKSTT